MLDQFRRRAIAHTFGYDFQGVVIRCRDAGHTTDGEAQIVIKLRKESVSMQQFFEYVIRKRAAFTKFSQHEPASTIDRVIRDVIAELQITHGEINVEHAA